MRALLERWARRCWSADAGWPVRAGSLALSPLAGLYRVALAGDRWRHRGPPVRVEGIRVVSVGNLAVGGTGKTPLTAWCVRRLADRGWHPAVVTRGYGGDEDLLHARWNPDVPVVVAEDRVQGVRQAAAAGADVAVLDDGFQHRRLARDVDLALLAAEDAFPGHVLPWGPYREPPSALERASAVVVTRRTASESAASRMVEVLRRRHPQAVVGQVALQAKGWGTLRGETTEPPGGPVLAVAGVARPSDFAVNVKGASGAPVELMGFGDHHAYTHEDVARMLRRAAGRPIVVTEKDAVKLMNFASELPETTVLRQQIRWESGMDDVWQVVAGPLEAQGRV